jgi:PmbA protein
MEKRRAEQILSLALDRGATAAEVYVREGVSSTIEVKDRTVDAFERARDRGVGVRVLAGQHMGFAYTTDLNERALRSVVDAALASARNTGPDPYHILAGRPTANYPEVSTYDPAVPAVSDGEKIERTLALEREAFAVDQRVRRIRKAATSFSESSTLILNSLGAESSSRGTAVSASIEVVAEENGEAQAGWEHDVRRSYRDIDIEAVGRRAARKALDLLGACRMDSVKAPVILEASVAQEFLDIIRNGFSAENVQKGKSLFAGKIGTIVASPLITVLDDGLLAGGLGTAPADDEAVPMQLKTVIAAGRLAMFLYNLRAAKQDGVASSGNGVRGGFRGVPGVGITNLYIQPGKTSPDELLKGTARGLFVNEIMGAHTANAISGDFSVGATGFWVEKGEKAYPVREITIAGNVIDVLKNVDAVCSDLRFSGRIGSPTLRINELSISGK